MALALRKTLGLRFVSGSDGVLNGSASNLPGRRYIYRTGRESPCKGIDMSPGGMAPVQRSEDRCYESVIVMWTILGGLEGLLRANRDWRWQYAATRASTISSLPSFTWPANRHIRACPKIADTVAFGRTASCGSPHTFERGQRRLPDSSTSPNPARDRNRSTHPDRGATYHR